MEVLLSSDVPLLREIGFLGFEYLAKLLDAIFDLRSGAIGHLEHERRSPAQIERHQRLQQVFTIQDAIAIGSGRLVDESNPELVGDVESLAVAVNKIR